MLEPRRTQRPESMVGLVPAGGGTATRSSPGRYWRAAAMDAWRAADDGEIVLGVDAVRFAADFAKRMNASAVSSSRSSADSPSNCKPDSNLLATKLPAWRPNFPAPGLK